MREAAINVLCGASDTLRTRKKPKTSDENIWCSGRCWYTPATCGRFLIWTKLTLLKSVGSQQMTKTVRNLDIWYRFCAAVASINWNETFGNGISICWQSFFRWVVSAKCYFKANASARIVSCIPNNMLTAMLAFSSEFLMLSWLPQVAQERTEFCDKSVFTDVNVLICCQCNFCLLNLANTSFP